jgi:hypothetical protein
MRVMFGLCETVAGQGVNVSAAGSIRPASTGSDARSEDWAVEKTTRKEADATIGALFDVRRAGYDAAGDWKRHPVPHASLR